MWNMCVVKEDQAFGNRLFQAPFVTVHPCAVFELIMRFELKLPVSGNFFHFSASGLV